MNNSPEYLRECEARQVLKMSDDKRQEYYRGVLAHRKQKGVDDLISEVKRQRKLMNKEKEMEI